MPLVVGLMNGTSVDGCDAALVHIEEGRATLLKFISLPTPPELKKRIFDCCSPEKSDVRLICSVNVEIGRFFAEATKAVCKAADVDTKDLYCIGSHGQTVYHIPTAVDGYAASTLQLGEPAVIAWETGAPVVSSFRAMDMAAGGRGAPLVPYTEYLLYRSDKARALQNLGGIGNVTVLPANCSLDQVFAFDTGPANMIVDGLMEHFYQKPYDEGGRVAAIGTVDQALLAEWMQIPFVTARPPKATGRELYGAQFVASQIAAHPAIRPKDFIATATEYTASTIAYNYRHFVFPRCAVREIILGGGGSHNNTLRRMLKELLPTCTVLTQEDLGMSSDAKEAVAFAMLAYETMNGRPSNAPAATGASCPVILGNITPAPLKQDE